MGPRIHISNKAEELEKVAQTAARQAMSQVLQPEAERCVAVGHKLTAVASHLQKIAEEEMQHGQQLMAAAQTMQQSAQQPAQSSTPAMLTATPMTPVVEAPLSPKALAEPSVTDRPEPQASVPTALAPPRPTMAPSTPPPLWKTHGVPMTPMLPVGKTQVEHGFP